MDTNAIAATDALLAKRRSDILAKIGFTNSEIGHEPFQEFRVSIDDTEGASAIPCAAWHLTFQRLILAGKEGVPLALGAQEISRMNHVGQVVNHIRMRYNLFSPDPYTEQELQDYLFEAAHLLVKQDTFSLLKACQWFKGSGLKVCGNQK
ncbi:MAG: hypothetical protein HY731_11230 [Candidatus Tectomicrobia bacterium]|nr:hypothetical protein [Candidatus Tectomicrobia bacterium]